jgi:hypothetical protein
MNRPLCINCGRNPAKPLALKRPPGVPAPAAHFCCIRCAAEYAIVVASLVELEVGPAKHHRRRSACEAFQLEVGGE